MAQTSTFNKTAETRETLLSYLLNNAPRNHFSSNASPQTLHPFASFPPNESPGVLKNLVQASAELSRTLQFYSSLTAPDHKFVSILRQSTTLIDSLHTSKQDAQRRIDALKARCSSGAATIYGEPIPLDDDVIVDWCISRIEDWGRKNGMEVFKEEGDRNGNVTLILGGKVLVVDVNIAVQRSALNSLANHITVSSVKTSYALSSGNSENALAEKSASLDAFILRTWNNYLSEVQRNDVDSSMGAAHISRDIQSHLSFLVKLDSHASQEGDQGIRWFNDTGLMSAVTDQITKAEVDSLSVALQVSKVNLDVFLSRAHALAIPYLVSPSMSFLVCLSPLAYYSLLRASAGSRSNVYEPNASDAFAKLDIPVSVLREQLTQRRSRPAGAVIATLMLAPAMSPLDRHQRQRPNLGRPYFRLPGTSMLASLDHTLVIPPPLTAKDSEASLSRTRDVWMLDFTDSGHSSGIVMPHSRMREIQQLIDPLSASSGMGFASHVQIPPLPGNWVGLLVNPALPPSERYIAVYESPSDVHPPLRLRLTVPNEAGFLLQRVPVTSLKEVYGILEIVRDQCWINETLKTVNWIPEDLMPESEDERDDADAMGAPEDELEALLNGTYTPCRIPVNVFLPVHPPSFPSIGSTDAANGLDPDSEHAVPGLSSVSMATAGSTSPPCIALAFTVHDSSFASITQKTRPVRAPHQVALVLRHDFSRKRGLRVDVNVTSADPGFGDAVAERPSLGLMDELEESSRRGAVFGTAGKIWAWLTREKNGMR